MLTENDVVNAVADYLLKHGYVIENTCTTNETGVDIIARNDATGKRLRVEAKGGTSSKEHTARFSLPFNPGQVKSHVSRAFYEAAVMLNKFAGDEVALAFPDDSHHHLRVAAIKSSLQKLEIGVFFVGEDGTVRSSDPGHFESSQGEDHAPNLS